MKTIKELELSLIVKEAMIQQLKFKNNQLKDKINKAIEYIETYKESFKNYIASDLEFNVYELLDILKGSGKE